MDTLIKEQKKKPFFKVYKNEKIRKSRKVIEPEILPLWKIIFNEGVSSKKTALNAIHTDNLSNEMIYNTICNSLDKTIRSQCLYNNFQPANFSLCCLIDEIIIKLKSNFPNIARMRFFLKFDQAESKIHTDDLIVMLNLLNDLSMMISKQIPELKAV